MLGYVCGTWGVGNEIMEREWIIVYVSLKCYKHYPMYLPGFGNYGLEIGNYGYEDMSEPGHR
ncbi:unnamed protein product [Prunus brigantina]